VAGAIRRCRFSLCPDGFGFDHPNHRRTVCLPGARFGRLFNDPFRTGAYLRHGPCTDRFACTASILPFHTLKGQRFIPDVGVDASNLTRIFTGKDKFGVWVIARGRAQWS
jgi:hypothetical protein